jgi:hypothetical protein
METCYCKEKCFYYNLISLNKINNNLEYRMINKCNRTNDSEKKKRCDYLTNKLVKTKEYKGEIIQKENLKNETPILTYRMVINELKILFKMSNPNQFLINKNLMLLQLKSWDPYSESLEELKMRLLKPQKKESTFVYYNEANMPKMNKSSYSFEWTNDDYVKKILKFRTKKNKRQSKKKTYEHIDEIDLIDGDFKIKNDSDEDKSDDDNDDDDSESINENKSEQGDDLNDFDNYENENNIEDDYEEFSD